MPGLMDSLNIARTGMAANRKAMEVTGNNIANVNTPGYSEQTAEAASIPGVETGGLTFGQGVNIEEISRAEDIFIEEQLQTAEEKSGRAKAQSTPLAELEQVFSVQGDNLATKMEEFFASWDDLAQNPAGEVERSQVIQRGKNVVSAFSEVERELNTVQSNINASLRSEVQTINSKLREVAELNTKIANAEATGRNAHSAMDDREMLLRDLSEKAGVSTYKGKNDMVSVALRGGQVLVQGEEANQLRFDSDTKNFSLDTGKTQTELGKSDFGGALEGMLRVREEVIPEVREQVETLQKDFVTAVNDQHTNGVGLDGNSYDFFDSSSHEVAISDTDHLAAGETSAPGDNRNAQAMANLADQEVVKGSFTFVDYYGKISGDVGIEVNQNQMDKESSQDTLTQLKNRREAKEGVSLKESMLDLTRYQKGFQAAANYMSKVDEMMQTLMGVAR